MDVQFMRARRIGTIEKYLLKSLNLPGERPEGALKAIELALGRNAEDTFVLIAMDQEAKSDDEQIVGFIISMAITMEAIQIFQLWVINGEEWSNDRRFEIARSMLEMVRKWSDTTLRTVMLHTIDSRDDLTMSMFSTLGFIPKATIMQLPLSKDDEILVEVPDEMPPVRARIPQPVGYKPHERMEAVEKRRAEGVLIEDPRDHQNVHNKEAEPAKVVATTQAEPVGGRNEGGEVPSNPPSTNDNGAGEPLGPGNPSK